MQSLKHFLSQLREAKLKVNLEKQFDQWVLRNPHALWTRYWFRRKQKMSYDVKFRRRSTLMKIMLIGYLTANIFGIDFNNPEPISHNYLTQYYVLSNHAEYDRLEQMGMESHLLELYERGLKRGLTQIELFELTKLHQLNQSARPLAYHLEYLRQLKS